MLQFNRAAKQIARVLILVCLLGTFKLASAQDSFYSPVYLHKFHTQLKTLQKEVRITLHTTELSSEHQKLFYIVEKKLSLTLLQSRQLSLQSMKLGPYSILGNQDEFTDFLTQLDLLVLAVHKLQLLFPELHEPHLNFFNNVVTLMSSNSLVHEGLSVVHFHSETLQKERDKLNTYFVDGGTYLSKVEKIKIRKILKIFSTLLKESSSVHYEYDPDVTLLLDELSSYQTMSTEVQTILTDLYVNLFDSALYVNFLNELTRSDTHLFGTIDPESPTAFLQIEELIKDKDSEIAESVFETSTDPSPEENHAELLHNRLWHLLKCVVGTRYQTQVLQKESSCVSLGLLLHDYLLITLKNLQDSSENQSQFRPFELPDLRFEGSQFHSKAEILHALWETVESTLWDESRITELMENTVLDRAEGLSSNHLKDKNFSHSKSIRYLEKRGRLPELHSSPKAFKEAIKEQWMSKNSRKSFRDLQIDLTDKTRKKNQEKPLDAKWKQVPDFQL